jgi:superfamily II DNA or RNA helicase
VKNRDGLTLPLFGAAAEGDRTLEGLNWPNHARFPLNLKGDINVGAVVEADLRVSERPLVITGYAALDRIANLMPTCKSTAEIRILFGTEPYLIKRGRYELSERPFPKEIEGYWLDRGISLFHSASIVHCIGLLETGRLKARFLGTSGKRLHAKIYCTENYATVGSSNFTRPGLGAQHEANARFSATSDPTRFKELTQIAENLWARSEDFSARLLELLNALLRIVEWEEAIARACAELLEGEWADHFLREQYFPDEGGLWPSQRQGIAQALYVLTRHGSVLIADATGSGKTRMGVALMGAISDHNLRTGRLRRGKSLLVCPPLVATNWEAESNSAGVPIDIRSHGVLSRDRGARHALTIDALRRAQVLSIDEGHNFLNFKSARTQKLLRNIADSVMVFTATPINRSVIDLLRIADMLGADNLEPTTIKMFAKLLKAKRLKRTLDKLEAESLREEIKRFTVRRTKAVLNRLIEREPNAYTDKNKKPCRFPKHIAEIYPLNESESDKQIAREIRDLADKLKAVTHFRMPLVLPESMRRRGITEKAFLEGRLNSSRKIAKYVIMKCLRSSKAALIEHIVGSSLACKEFALDTSHKDGSTGNIVEKLKDNAGKLPRNKLKIPLPEWLSDEEAHRQASADDQNIYTAILERTRRVSDNRDQAKADLLLLLAKSSVAVLAFDSHPISLAVIRQRITANGGHPKVLLATGGNASGRDALLTAFSLDSQAADIIGLCSDSLSEGVNLQRASNLVHLDMPSVVRVAEQRVGRIDRLDSPHKEITAWWPDDAPEFALSSDERFLERYDTVDVLLGSNMPLPDEMRPVPTQPIKTRELIAEIEREAALGTWDGVHDAFESVRALVEGPDALVGGQTYDHYRNVRARVVSRVSVVRSNSSWAFFCLSGGEFGAPRWLFMPSVGETPISELERVSAELRARLGPDTENLRMDARASAMLAKFLESLGRAERTLLSARKRIAIDEFEFALEHMTKNAVKRKEQSVVDRLVAIHSAIKSPSPDGQPDWDEVASRWLDLIRPIWYERLCQPRERPLLLKEIRADVLKNEATLCTEVLKAFESIPLVQSADERIAVCILGIRGVGADGVRDA